LSNPLEFSIVIPSRDHHELLRQCLTSIAALATPRDEFEVIVVDDGSRSPYDEWLPEFDGRFQLRSIRRDGSGPGQARNAGARAARGCVIALTDDDCAPSPDWLLHFKSALSEHPGCVVGGRTVNGIPHNAYSEASQLLSTYLYSYYNADPSHARFFASCNMAMPVEAFHAFGGFGPAFALAGGEDRDLCDRWHASGRPMIYAPLAVVHHHHELSLIRLLRQHFNYGRGAWHFHQARAARHAARVRVEPLRFYSELLAFPFRQGTPCRPALVSALIGASQAANAAGFFFERFFR